MIATAAMALLLGGCGSGDRTTTSAQEGSSKSASSETASSGGGSVTKAAFIEEADQLCKAAERQITSEIRESSAKKGIDPTKRSAAAPQEALIEDVVLPGYKRQAEELDELTPPDGDEAEIAAIVSGIEKAVAEAEKVPNKILEAAKEFQGVAKLAVDYGMKSCGQP